MIAEEAHWCVSQICKEMSGVNPKFIAKTIDEFLERDFHPGKWNLMIAQEA